MEKNFLIICNAQTYTDDISQCNEFNQVQTYFIKKELERNNFRCEAYGYQSWMGLKKRIKSYYGQYLNNFDFNLYNNFNNIFFTGAIPLKSTHPDIIKDIRKNVSGIFAETNEYRRNPKGDVEFFALPGEESQSSVWIGPMYCADSLYPEKQYNELIIHIDHHFPGRADCSDVIKQKIKDLENNVYFRQHWKGYQLYYHSRKLNSIDELDFYNRPPDIPFSELSKLYRKTHVAFLSHRETLGMYPIEVTASGAFVVCLQQSLLPPSIKNLIGVIPDSSNFWNNLLPMINQTNVEKNVEKVKNSSYREGVKKMISIMEEIHDNKNKSDSKAI